MINKQKSIALYGAPGCGSKYIAKELSERTGLPVIPVRQLAFLPNKKDLDKAVRYSQLSITNLQDERDAYKKRLDSIYLSGDAIITLRQKIAECDASIKRYQDNLQSLQPTIALRNQFPDVKNYVELGYNRELATYMEQNYGIAGKEFYNKQFEVELIKNIYANTHGAYIIDYPATAPVCLQDSHDAIATGLNNGRLVMWSFNDGGFIRENLTPEATDELFEGFGTVVNLQLPADYTETRYAAATNPQTGEMLADGGYEANATMTQDTTGLFDENVEAVLFLGEEKKVHYSKAKAREICNNILSPVQVETEDLKQ